MILFFPQIIVIVIIMKLKKTNYYKLLLLFGHMPSKILKGLSLGLSFKYFEYLSF